jgi:hypothetical protein
MRNNSLSGLTDALRLREPLPRTNRHQTQSKVSLRKPTKSPKRPRV